MPTPAAGAGSANLLQSSKAPRKMIKLNTGLNVGGPTNVKHVGGHAKSVLSDAISATPQQSNNFMT
jgi:hypothetical protein